MITNTDNGQETNFTVTYRGHEFHALVNTDFNQEGFAVRMGGAKKTCVTIFVNNQQKYVILEDLKFMSECIKRGALSRSHGTKVLLFAALYFTQSLLRQQHNARARHYRFILQDSSQFQCSPQLNVMASKSTVIMSDYNMLIYGKTWYQRLLATRKHPSSALKLQPGVFKQADLDNSKAILTLHVHMKPFQNFWSMCVPDTLRQDWRPFKARLCQMYESSTAYLDFFRKVHDAKVIGPGSLDNRNRTQGMPACAFIASIMPNFLHIHGMVTMYHSPWECMLNDLLPTSAFSNRNSKRNTDFSYTENI